MSYKPKILSIHPTVQCDYHCFNCYLKKNNNINLQEKDHNFFEELIRVAKIEGIEEIAATFNYVADSLIDKNLESYKLIKKTTEEIGLKLSITCNYEFIDKYKDIVSFNNLNIVNISMNDFVTSTSDKKKKCLETMLYMKSKAREVNCNILISLNMVHKLNAGLFEEILETADTIYILASKPLYISLKSLYSILKKLDKRIIDKLEDKVFIDTCIRREMGLTGGMCHRHQFISISPYGEVKNCSYDQKNIYILEKPSDFQYTYRNIYPEKPIEICELVTQAGDM